jgi:hypothetical protein
MMSDGDLMILQNGQFALEEATKTKQVTLRALSHCPFHVVEIAMK